MLEQDYLKNSPNAITSSVDYTFKDERSKALNEYSTQLIRELIIPKLNKEINSSKRYAGLRQVYYSLILSRWFKSRFKGLSPKGTDPNFVDLIDKQDLTNLTSKTTWDKSTYFQAYKKSFTQGEYNIQEAVYTPTGQVIRSYMSGGMNFASSVIQKALEEGAILPAFGSRRFLTTEHHFCVTASASPLGDPNDLQIRAGSPAAVTPSSTTSSTMKTRVRNQYHLEVLDKHDRIIHVLESKEGEGIKKRGDFSEALYHFSSDGKMLLVDFPTHSGIHTELFDLETGKIIAQEYGRELSIFNRDTGKLEHSLKTTTGFFRNSTEWLSKLKDYLDLTIDSKVTNNDYRISMVALGTSSEELYSLAIILSEMLHKKKQDIKQWKVQIKGYDINPILAQRVEKGYFRGGPYLVMPRNDFRHTDYAFGQFIRVEKPNKIWIEDGEEDRTITYLKLKDETLNQWISIETIDLSSETAESIRKRLSLNNTNVIFMRYLANYLGTKRNKFLEDFILNGNWLDPRYPAFYSYTMRTMRPQEKRDCTGIRTSGSSAAKKAVPILEGLQEIKRIVEQWRAEDDRRSILIVIDSEGIRGKTELASGLDPEIGSHYYKNFQNLGLNLKQDILVLYGDPLFKIFEKIYQGEEEELEKIRELTAKFPYDVFIDFLLSKLQEKKEIKYFEFWAFLPSYISRLFSRMASVGQAQDRIIVFELAGAGGFPALGDMQVINVLISKDSSTGERLISITRKRNETLAGSPMFGDIFKEIAGLPSQKDLLEIAKKEKAVVLTTQQIEDKIDDAENKQFAESLRKLLFDMMFAEGGTIKSHQLSRYAAEAGISVADFKKELGIPDWVLSLIIIDKNAFKGTEDQEFLHQVLMEEIFHLLEGENEVDARWKDSLYIELSIHNELQETLNDFLQLMFYPLDQLNKFSSVYTEWTEDEQKALIQRYRIIPNHNPNKGAEIRKIIETLHMDIKQDAMIKVGLNDISLVGLFIRRHLKRNTNLAIERLLEFLEIVLTHERFSAYPILFSSWTLPNRSDIGSNSGSSSMKHDMLSDPSTLGGIDFRSLPIVSQAMTNLSANLRDSHLRGQSLNNVNLDEEWRSIERLESSGIKLSPERLREFAQAACAKDAIGEVRDKIILCISDILRQEEDTCCETDPVLRDILVVLESVSQPKELKEVFLGKVS